MRQDELLVNIGRIISNTELALKAQTSKSGKAYLRGYLDAMGRIFGIMMEQKPENGVDTVNRNYVGEYFMAVVFHGTYQIWQVNPSVYIGTVDARAMAVEIVNRLDVTGENPVELGE